MIPLTVYSLVLLVPAIVDGTRAVPQETLAAATAMGFGSLRRFLQVELPIAVPAIIAGLRLAVVSSISLVSVGTLIGNQGALGNLLADGQFYHRTPLIVTSVVTTALLAIAVDGLLVLLQVLLTPWAPRGRKGARRIRSAEREPDPGTDAAAPAAPASLEDAVR
jgi:osmoprotectant transport system permease protein